MRRRLQRRRRIAQEEAEKERIAKEAEKERFAKEAAEKERIAKGGL